MFSQTLELSKTLYRVWYKGLFLFTINDIKRSIESVDRLIDTDA